MILWLLFILLETYRNYYLIEVKKTRPVYLQSFVIRGIAAILHGAFMGVGDEFEYWQTKELLLDMGAMLLLQTTMFMVIFSPLLNLLRKKPLTYLGQNSGWLDRYPSLHWTIYGFSVIYLIIYFV